VDVLHGVNHNLTHVLQRLEVAHGSYCVALH
jgi:hypothetical protein